MTEVAKLREAGEPEPDEGEQQLNASHFYTFVYHSPSSFVIAERQRTIASGVIMWEFSPKVELPKGGVRKGQ